MHTGHSCVAFEAGLNLCTLSRTLWELLNCGMALATIRVFKKSCEKKNTKENPKLRHQYQECKTQTSEATRERKMRAFWGGCQQVDSERPYRSSASCGGKQKIPARGGAFLPHHSVLRTPARPAGARWSGRGLLSLSPCRRSSHLQVRQDFIWWGTLLKLF